MNDEKTEIYSSFILMYIISMKYIMKKYNRFIALILILSVSILLVACGDRSGISDDTDSYIDESMIEEYIFIPYVPQSGAAPVLSYPVSGTVMHEDLFFYWYMDSLRQLVVAEMDASGIVARETYIPLAEGVIQIGGLLIAGDEYFDVITISNNTAGDRSIDYVKYNRRGESVSVISLSHIIPDTAFRFYVSQVVFSDDGEFVLAVNEGGFGYELYLFNNNGVLSGRLQLDYNLEIIRLKDGRVVALNQDGDSYSLREIDFDKGEWGRTIPLSVNSAQGLFPAGLSQSYDFFIDTGSHLIGYSLNAGIQTILLNLVESGFVNLWNHYIGFFSDNRFIALSAEISYYMQISRDDLQEHQVILTLGGAGIPDEIRREVVRFNRENGLYQIQLIVQLLYVDSVYSYAKNSIFLHIRLY